MSVVYMAINEKANKTWAVKELRREGVVNYEAVRNGLIAETEILKKLHHPHLPSIVDVIEDQDSLLIVMDYVEGVSLNVNLEEYGAQPQELVIEWGKQLCDVLAYLHSRKPPIIYRDMKPGNVMLRPDGNLTLIDFGTAREFKARNIADTTCLGTIGYAAPEQFGGQGQTDARTDIYGLGATLYHLVTGLNPSEPPYEIRPIRELDPTLSGGLEKIILKCVQKNPDDRYQSAEELMYALENYEKVDDRYRSMLKVRLASFFAVLALAIVFSILAVGNQMIASGNQGKEYADLIADAKTTADYETSLKTFEAAINIPDQNGQGEAYLGLIQAYKANDHLFTVDEARQLERLISENRDALLKNPKEYVDICFETGKLFWYYYAYGDIENNQVTRAKSAIEWFQEVMRYAPQAYENLAMAKVYSNVGIFYRDIQTAVTEADDKGRYKPLFDNIVQMTESIAKNENESEIVRLELLELGRSALQQYATKLKVDGVTEDEMRALLSDIRSILEDIQTTTETSTNRKEESLRHIGQTHKAIDTAFSTGKDQ